MTIPLAIAVPVLSLAAIGAACLVASFTAFGLLRRNGRRERAVLDEIEAQGDLGPRSTRSRE